MKIYVLKKEQIITRTIEEVFSFFERPENLAKITPPSLGFEVLTPSPIEMKAGTLIDYTVKTLGIRRRWTTLISGYDPPHRFVDVQLMGPYLFWHHTHTFEAIEDGTRIIDEVRYVLPFGWLGRMADRLIVGRQLETIFSYRANVIADVFAAVSNHSHVRGN